MFCEADIYYLIEPITCGCKQRRGLYIHEGCCKQVDCTWWKELGQASKHVIENLLYISIPVIPIWLLSFSKTSHYHYDDVIMTMLESQITSLMVVYSIVYSGVNQRKHQSSASLAFVREIHRGPVNFPHKWPVTRKMFPFDDVILTINIIIILIIIILLQEETKLLIFIVNSSPSL